MLNYLEECSAALHTLYSIPPAAASEEQEHICAAAYGPAVQTLPEHFRSVSVQDTPHVEVAADAKGNTMPDFATLLNGVQMPLVGLGTWQLDGEQCVSAVYEAIKTGEYHFVLCVV